jgi:threonine aldolase
MVIDLRSDTVTKPSPGMLEAILKAAVGDDVFGEDPTVNELEAYTADLFGMEAALYCASGTMSNQIAIKCHTQPGDEVICAKNAHISIYEGGGIAFNSGCQVRYLEGDRGRINSEQVAEAINPDDVHKPNTSLVCLENTSNRGGGSCYDLGELSRIREVCDRNHLRFHLDGARLFNALIVRQESPKQYGAIFDSISVCLNKGLGCPVGSLLMGKKEFIKKGRRVRKVFGGGLRQAGFMAATGLFALHHQVQRLAEDHLRAKKIAEALKDKPFVHSILPVETNIVSFEIQSPYTPQDIVARLKERSLLSIAISPTQIRMVTHLDISEGMLSEALKIVREL